MLTELICEVVAQSVALSWPAVSCHCNGPAMEAIWIFLRQTHSLSTFFCEQEKLFIKKGVVTNYTSKKKHVAHEEIAFCAEITPFCAEITPTRTSPAHREEEKSILCNRVWAYTEKEKHFWILAEHQRSYERWNSGIHRKKRWKLCIRAGLPAYVGMAFNRRGINVTRRRMVGLWERTNEGEKKGAQGGRTSIQSEIDVR